MKKRQLSRLLSGFWYMKKIYILVPILGIMFLTTTPIFANEAYQKKIPVSLDEVFCIKFGIFNTDGDPYNIKETLRIPFKPIKPGSSENTNFSYGFVLWPKARLTTGSSYTTQVKFYFPAPIDGDMSYISEIKNNTEPYQFSVRSESNYPLGSYKIEVYVNGVLFKTINYELIP